MRQLADAAVRVFDGGFSKMCDVLGAGCSAAPQVEPDLPASPTKRRRMGDGGSAASPTSTLVIPLGFEPGLVEQHLCMLGSCRWAGARCRGWLEHVSSETGLHPWRVMAQYTKQPVPLLHSRANLPPAFPLLSSSQ